MKLQGKYIADSTVRGRSIQLNNDEWFRALSSTSTNTNLFKFNSQNRIEFASVPQVSTNAVLPNDLVRLEQVQNLIENFSPKEATRVATTANITLSGLQTIDGVTLIAGDRVLVKNQNNAAQNGIWVSAVGSWTRAIDADTADEINSAYVAIQEGSTNAGRLFVQNNKVVFLETDPINFIFFNSASGVSGGQGITVIANEVSVDILPNSGLTFTGDQLSVKLNTTGSANVANSLVLDSEGIGIKIDDTTIESGSFQRLQVKNHSIGNSKLTFAPAFTLKGNNTANSTQLQDLQVVDVKNLLDYLESSDIDSLAKLNTIVGVTLDTSTDSRPPTAHTTTHIQGGSDPINAALLDNSFVPSNYTQDTSVFSLGTLGAHLQGIDNLIATTTLDIAGKSSTLITNLNSNTGPGPAQDNYFIKWNNPSQSWELTSSSITTAMSNIADVSNGTPNPNHVLIGNGTSWVSQQFTVSNITASGTADATTFLRGDGSWQVVDTSLTNGNGTTANGSAVDLGGTITSNRVFDFVPASNNQIILQGDSGTGGTFIPIKIINTNTTSHNKNTNILIQSPFYNVETSIGASSILTTDTIYGLTVANSSELSSVYLSVSQTGTGTPLNPSTRETSFKMGLTGAVYRDRRDSNASWATPGITYFADYSATFTNRSLVDKEYVDNAISAATPSIVWGGITGTLSNQTDLQNALNGKADTSHNHTTAQITSGTFADALIAQSNVTQHQAALTITESQISDLQAYLLDAPNDGNQYARQSLGWAQISIPPSDEIKDADNDTYVRVETTADEDKIRFGTASVERAVIDSTGLLVSNQAGTGERFVTATSTGLQEATVEGLELYITNATAISDLTTGVANEFNIITGITNALEGQQYHDPATGDTYLMLTDTQAKVIRNPNAVITAGATITFDRNRIYGVAGTAPDEIITELTAALTVSTTGAKRGTVTWIYHRSITDPLSGAQYKKIGGYNDDNVIVNRIQLMYISNSLIEVIYTEV